MEPLVTLQTVHWQNPKTGQMHVIGAGLTAEEMPEGFPTEDHLHLFGSGPPAAPAPVNVTLPQPLPRKLLMLPDGTVYDPENPHPEAKAKLLTPGET
jgi:hypothetical protein